MTSSFRERRNMPYQTELEECCKAMNQFARDRLLTIARGLAANFPAEQPNTPLLTLVKNVRDTQHLGCRIDRDVDRNPIGLVR